MVVAKSIVQKILEQVSLYGILLAVMAATIFYFVTIDWSHVVIMIAMLIFHRYQKLNINFLITFSLFYIISLFALHRYDMDKINEIMMAHFLPVLLMIVFYFFLTRSGRFLTIMNKIAFYINRLGKFMTKPIPKKYTKHLYILVAILFSYFTMFIFQGLLGIYGGLIVLFSGFHIARFLLTRGKQIVFLYGAIFIYVAIYNLTLTHGITILIDDPLTYLYIYMPTIIIPLIFTIIYQWEYLRDDLF